MWRLSKLFIKLNFALYIFLYATSVLAKDMSNISGVDDMLVAGQDMIRVAAKWGGIVTVVTAALALGSGRLEGALAQTICKILIVVGLLIAAMSFFGNKISWGFAF
jgi:voltage-gated potassium channel Kch